MEGKIKRKIQHESLETAKTTMNNQKLKVFGVKLEPDFIKDVKMEALKRDMTIQEYVKLALVEFKAKS